MNYKVTDLPSSERPRERLKRLGSEALSIEELLAILIGAGSRREPVLKLARELLVRFGSLREIDEAALEELQTIPGIGPATAFKIKAALSLGSRVLRENSRESQSIRTAKDAYQIALPYIEKEKREIFFALLVNVKGQLIGIETISMGTLSEVPVHPREFFYPAIRRKAFAIIAIHNHPSGVLTPSKDDLELTEQLIEGAHLIGIPLLDHLIINENTFYSLREHGLKFYKNSFKEKEERLKYVIA